MKYWFDSDGVLYFVSDLDLVISHGGLPKEEVPREENMFKNKWLWALLTLCCFILAGFAAKGQMSSPQSLTANTAITAQGQAVAQKAAASSTSLETEKIKGDRAVALSGDVEMPVIARGEEARRMVSVLEPEPSNGVVVIPPDAQFIRDEEMNLDDACSIINGNVQWFLQSQQ
jgi:hypothetical protein